jgi:lipopolysaccharide/colanic/teichoic acid biosynthesis glycosyltransferase
MYRSFFKRAIDMAAAVCGLVVVSPLFILICCVLLIANRGKVFFLQLRPGKDERLFHVIKFRTMNDRRSKEGQLLPDADRMTAIGRFLRKTSMDELPQLINVLTGQMSLIGPRPLLVEYLPLYSEVQRKRHSIRPGITGWAQVNGRNAISWEQKFELDVWYVDNLNFSLDCKIIVFTIMKVVKSEGISQQGHVTMTKF